MILGHSINNKYLFRCPGHWVISWVIPVLYEGGYQIILIVWDRGTKANMENQWQMVYSSHNVSFRFVARVPQLLLCVHPVFQSTVPSLRGQHRLAKLGQHEKLKNTFLKTVQGCMCSPKSDRNREWGGGEKQFPPEHSHATIPLPSSHPVGILEMYATTSGALF